EGRAAEGADLAGTLQVGERAQGLVDVARGVGAVDLVQGDPVGLQAAQARLALTDDPAPRVALSVGVVAHLGVHLGGEHDLVPPSPGEGLADDLLGLALGVDVGGVHEVDPRVEGAVDDADRVFVILVTPGAEHHGAEAERADLDPSAAESALLHLSDDTRSVLDEGRLWCPRALGNREGCRWDTSSEWALSQARDAIAPRTRRGQQSCPTPVPRDDVPHRPPALAMTTRTRPRRR